MAKKGKVKKVVNKLLDKTELDEKLVAEYNENKNLIDDILCYIKCYGGYLLAVGAGCTFGVSAVWGIVLLAAAAYWAYYRSCRKLCSCCNKNSCEK